jgi:hypothetical protein
MKVLPVWVAGALALCALPSTTSAQLIRVDPDCDYWMGVNVLNQFDPNAQACAGAFAGNDVPQQDDVIAEIESQGWAGGSPVVYSGTTDAGDSGGPFSSVGSGSTGTIVFSSPLTGDYIFALKVANQFSLYFFSGLVDATQLTYSTLGTSTNPSGTAQGLSHVSLYTVTPEPGTVLLLATGLLSLFFVARRRRRKTEES